MKPSDSFGDDVSPALRTIADQVRGMTIGALPSAQYQDVVDILEYMRDENLKRYDALDKRAAEITARFDALIQREKDLALRQRTIEVAAGIAPKKRNFWR